MRRIYRFFPALLFALYLWRCVKYDGVGCKFTLRYALDLAFDHEFWAGK